MLGFIIFIVTTDEPSNASWLGEEEKRWLGEEEKQYIDRPNV